MNPKRSGRDVGSRYACVAGLSIKWAPGGWLGSGCKAASLASWDPAGLPGWCLNAPVFVSLSDAGREDSTAQHTRQHGTTQHVNVGSGTSAVESISRRHGVISFRFVGRGGRPGRQDSRDATANKQQHNKKHTTCATTTATDRTYPIRSPAHHVATPPQQMPTAHPPFPTMSFYSPSPAPGNPVIVQGNGQTGYLRGGGPQGPGLKGRADSEASIEQKSGSHSSQSSICSTVWTLLATRFSLHSRIASHHATRCCGCRF